MAFSIYEAVRRGEPRIHITQEDTRYLFGPPSMGVASVTIIARERRIYLDYISSDDKLQRPERREFPYALPSLKAIANEILRWYRVVEDARIKRLIKEPNSK